MTKIDLNNLDKSSWQSFKFEEIAFKISESVDPNKTDLGVYIGLEHIDAEDIHIRRTGTPNDVNGQKLKCYPGDIIFGKRRAYQRKAAIVNFEGICSAHAFVLRANPESIDPKLFPFFLHSDQFMHRMVDISVGGLSPTINWGDLKHQEFLLPPKDQQSQLAELLWAMDEVIQGNINVLDSLETLRIVKEKEFFMSKTLKLEVEAENFFDKIADGTHDTPVKKNNGFKLLTSKNIKENKLDFETDYYISEEDYNSVNKRSKVDKNDILFGMIGTVGQVSRILEEPNYAIKNMGLFKTKNETKSLVGYYYFKSRFFQKKLFSELSGTTQKYVSLSYLRSLKLPNHTNLNVLNWLQSELEFEKNLNYVQTKIKSSQSLQKSLINQIL